MKTKNLNILFLLLSVLVTASCLKDNPLVDWPKENRIIEFPYRSNDHSRIFNNVTADFTFEVLVNSCAVYASHNTSDIKVDLGTNESRVDVYNREHLMDGSTAAKQPYILLDAENYSLPASVTIPKGTKLTSFEISVGVSTLEPGRYLLPIVISSVPDPYIISGNFGHLYVLIEKR